MSEYNKTIDVLKERVKDCLPQYLSGKGINTTKLFCCINPDHQDNNPSCGLIPGTNDRLFHCFSCNAVGDIFTAAFFLEGRPQQGRGFLQENLAHLVREVLQEEMPDLPSLSEEDLIESETYSAYMHAAMIIKNSNMSDLVKARVSEMGWPKEVMLRIGIGSVASYEDYIDRMTKHYGHKLEFLEKIDLAGKNGKKHQLFHPNNLIFTVRDENGSPVGFAAMELTYSDKKL